MLEFVGKPIPGLSEALMEVLPPITIDRVAIDDVVKLMEAKGFAGTRVRNHIAWLCTSDPRVDQQGVLKMQRETKAELKGEQ